MFVRTASERDLTAIRALLVETWHATYDALYGVAKVTEITDAWHSLEALKRRLATPRSEFLVADDGKTVGGMAFAQADQDGKAVDIRQLYVLPAFQGRGIGGLLMDEIEDSFPEARSFRLEVESANPRAVRFYELRGYIDAGSSSGDCSTRGVSSTARQMVRERGTTA